MSNDQTEHLPPDGTRSTRNQLGPQYANALNLGSAPAQGYQGYQGQQAAARQIEPDYYQLNCLMQPSVEHPWQVHDEKWPTLEEADKRVESLVSSGAKSVRVTPGYWK